MWASHLHFSALIPPNIPLFYFFFFQIWDGSILITNLVTVGFGALAIPGQESHVPWAVHWVCRIRIVPPTPSVSWWSERLFDGKISCTSFHILYPCVYTHWKRLKSTLRHNSVFSLLWDNYRNWNLSIISIISFGCYQNVLMQWVKNTVVRTTQWRPKPNVACDQKKSNQFDVFSLISV